MAKFPEIYFSHLVHPDPFYKSVMADILAQRSMDTQLSILDLCEAVGKFAKDVYQEEGTDKEVEKRKERFFISLYFLVKFLYPIIDQLETAADKHLEIHREV